MGLVSNHLFAIGFPLIFWGRAIVVKMRIRIYNNNKLIIIKCEHDGGRGSIRKVLMISIILICLKCCSIWFTIGHHFFIARMQINYFGVLPSPSLSTDSFSWLGIMGLILFGFIFSTLSFIVQLDLTDHGITEFRQMLSVNPNLDEGEWEGWIKVKKGGGGRKRKKRIMSVVTAMRLRVATCGTTTWGTNITAVLASATVTVTNSSSGSPSARSSVTRFQKERCCGSYCVKFHRCPIYKLVKSSRQSFS